jgi:hypothetical protein
MTPISEVFVLTIDSKLDYELLKMVCMTGCSSVPVYEEVDVPIRQKKKLTITTTAIITVRKRRR